MACVGDVSKVTFDPNGDSHSLPFIKIDGAVALMTHNGANLWASESDIGWKEYVAAWSALTMPEIRKLWIEEGERRGYELVDA